tara:strand:+ start:885 stop:1613 length:729 start_codon:yes stop_codon:yes gene_type:complete
MSDQPIISRRRRGEPEQAQTNDPVQPTEPPVQTADQPKQKKRSLTPIITGTTSLAISAMIVVVLMRDGENVETAASTPDVNVPVDAHQPEPSIVQEPAVDQEHISQMLHGAADEWRAAERTVAEIRATKRDIGFFVEARMQDAKRDAEESILRDERKVAENMIIVKRSISTIVNLALQAPKEVQSIVTKERAMAYQKGYKDREQIASITLDALKNIPTDPRGIEGVVEKFMSKSFPQVTQQK